MYNISMLDLHNRMPVILQHIMMDDWIKSKNFTLSYLYTVMQ